MSFKLGQGERLAEGRLFVDHTEMTLRSALCGLPVEFVDAWQLPTCGRGTKTSAG
jgi:hypothetical protein